MMIMMIVTMMMMMMMLMTLWKYPHTASQCERSVGAPLASRFATVTQHHNRYLKYYNRYFKQHHNRSYFLTPYPHVEPQCEECGALPLASRSATIRMRFTRAVCARHLVWQSVLKFLVRAVCVSIWSAQSVLDWSGAVCVSIWSVCVKILCLRSLC
jgi:hypothetical protein